MAKKNSKAPKEVESSINPVDESRELEIEQADSGVLPGEFVQVDEDAAHIIFTRDNLILIGPKFWLYNHDGSLADCKGKTAFNGQMARDFGIREGDTVACMPLVGEGSLIKVPRKD